MIQAGIIPSSQRLREYLQACWQKQDFNQEVDKVLSCLADILRLEEEKILPTEPSLKELLILLESDNTAKDLQLALSRITISAKEPTLPSGTPRLRSGQADS